MQRNGQRARAGAAGFTILEMLVSTAIFLLVLYGVYLVYDVGGANYRTASREWDVQSQARIALERMAREIRMAGYSDAAKLPDPIVIATNDTLSFHATINSSLGPQYITYGRRNCGGVGGTTLYRSASTTAYCGGDAFIDGVSLLTFTYYELNGTPIPYPVQTTYTLDGQNYVTGTSTPTTPGAQRNAIRQVKITLTVQQQVGGATIPFTATTDVTLRNLVP
ncbi:MAG TPA: prepilin-type N-terminal cleavage/methylation domain-containing protein [Candidatus Methylomirabilis sp.]|nr:prepilin-type N-terminal cleavage/methylation domain-containing protein [Candidatus Methylomirabilis sp.]